MTSATAPRLGCIWLGAIVTGKAVFIHTDDLRALIRAKISDGRLARNSPSRVWGGKGAGALCAARERVIRRDEFVLGGVRAGEGREALEFHVECFWIWDSEVRSSPLEVPGCAYCQRGITSDQDGTTVQGVAYHSVCRDKKIRGR